MYLTTWDVPDDGSSENVDAIVIRRSCRPEAHLRDVGGSDGEKPKAASCKKRKVRNFGEADDAASCYS